MYRWTVRHSHGVTEHNYTSLHQLFNVHHPSCMCLCFIFPSLVPPSHTYGLTCVQVCLCDRVCVHFLSLYVCAYVAVYLVCLSLCSMSVCSYFTYLYKYVYYVFLSICLWMASLSDRFMCLFVHLCVCLLLAY